MLAMHSSLLVPPFRFKNLLALAETFELYFYLVAQTKHFALNRPPIVGVRFALHNPPTQPRTALKGKILFTIENPGGEHHDDRPLIPSLEEEPRRLSKTVLQNLIHSASDTNMATHTIFYLPLPHRALNGNNYSTYLLSGVRSWEGYLAPVECYMTRSSYIHTIRRTKRGISG